MQLEQIAAFCCSLPSQLTPSSFTLAALGLCSLRFFPLAVQFVAPLPYTRNQNTFKQFHTRARLMLQF